MKEMKGRNEGQRCGMKRNVGNEMKGRKGNVGWNGKGQACKWCRAGKGEQTGEAFDPHAGEVGERDRVGELNGKCV